jgi:predicted metal-dependent hydrolase
LTERTVPLEGVGPVLFVKSRRARRIGLTVRALRGVRVVLPAGGSFDQALTFALGKRAWIRRAQARIGLARERCREAVEAAARIDRRSARDGLAGRLEILSREHGFAPGKLCVRRQGTIWGSATRAGRIQLNLLLAVLPPDLADYVILHELVHTRVRGHGRDFWAELGRLVPDLDARRARLREYSLALF